MQILRNVTGCALALAFSSLSQAQLNPTQFEFRQRAPAVIGRALSLGHASPSKKLNISVSLPYGDPAGMQAFVDSVNDPRSPNYRHFITPDQVGNRFGLSPEKVAGVERFLRANGMKINLVAKNRLNILAESTVDQAEKAFGTVINEFQAQTPDEPGNHRFFSYTKALSVPPEIASYVVDVSGLENFTRPQPRALTPTQARALYNLKPIYDSGLQGQGRSVAISNWDGYRLSNVPLYYSQFGLPSPSGGVGSNIHPVSINGSNGNTASVGAEADLDIQMVLGMAPLCDLYIYDNAGGSDLIGVLTREVNDNLADVISESWGWSLGSSTATSAHNLHLSMSAQGITYMAASGDSGTSIEPYSYPDYDPEVLLIGGTVATVDSNGLRTSEVGWSGSGGGWSTNAVSFNVRPSWQVGNGVPTNVNKRLGPDVGFHASSSSGAYQFYLNGSLSSGYVGTSFASPVVAGALAVAEQKIIANGGLPADGNGKRRFGRMQDLIYAQNGRSDVWFDVTSGANGTLPDGTASSAHAGWDYVTGWGAINWSAFVSSQTSSTPDFGMSTSPASQSVVQGNATSFTTLTSSLNGYSGTVAFSVSGLPSGAVGTFTPTSTTAGGSTTLNVTTSASTPVGSYPLTITGTDGTITHTNSATLNVTALAVPNFTISASPSSRTIKRGKSTTYTVTVTGSGGFNGSVALSATGMGSGEAVSFSPVSINSTGTATMTVSTTGGAARGAFTLVITGTSGSLVHSTSVKLSVK